MLEFIILMAVLNLLMKWKVGTKELITYVPQQEAAQEKPGKAYVLGNSAEYEFKSLDDAMEFREMRLSGWSGNAIDFYKWKEEA